LLQVFAEAVLELGETGLSTLSQLQSHVFEELRWAALRRGVWEASSYPVYSGTLLSRFFQVVPGGTWWLGLS